jgi:hypothetical protein
MKYYVCQFLEWDGDSGVGMATARRQDDRGVGIPSPSRIKNCLFHIASRPFLGPALPPI